MKMELKNFGNWIQELKKEAGFAYMTVREETEPYDDTVYNYYGFVKPGADTKAKIVAVRGISSVSEEAIKFVESEGLGDEIMYANVRKFIDDLAKVDRPVNEVVIKRDLPTEISTDKILYSREKKAARKFSYYVMREPKEDQGIQIINQTLITDKDSYLELVDILREHPELTSTVFEGVFPKLEEKYPPQRNGRIVFLGDHALDAVHNPDLTERLAVNYELKSE